MVENAQGNKMINAEHIASSLQIKEDQLSYSSKPILKTKNKIGGGKKNRYTKKRPQTNRNSYKYHLLISKVSTDKNMTIKNKKNFEDKENKIKNRKTT